MLLYALLLAADSLTRPLGALPTGITDGYAATQRGETFGYHSAHPTQRASLLVRSLDSTNAAVWTTAPITTDGSATRHVAFLAAMDVTDAGQTPVRFWVSVNGAHRFALPQPTSDAEHWDVNGADGIVMHFRRLLIDKFGDVHGVFTIDVPPALAPVGAPIMLQVRGENVGRMSWFILYTISMQPTIAAHAEQMLVRAGAARLQTVRFDVWNPFDTTTVSVTSATKSMPSASERITAGSVVFRVNVPAVRRPSKIALLATATVGGVRSQATFAAVPLLPVVPREIYLINHNHLDIGYTDVHEKVRDKHWRAMDSAIVFAERSRAYSTGARFNWNVEGLWPLDAYLAQRSAADTARLLAAVRRGDLTLNATYANLMTGLSSGEELIHLLDYTRTLRRDHGVAITTATSSDVPGFTWGLVPALALQGIRYLSSGPNYMPGPSQDGDRIGHTLAAWGDKPFWWIGPSGRDSVMVLTAGRGYSWAGGWPSGRITLADANVMSEYMDDLVARKYPWDIVQVRVAIGGDNGYPDAQLADVVQAWNARFESPKLVIATLPKLFSAMERRHGTKLPRIRGDLTGFWEDGAMSSAREQIMNRASAARIVQAGTLAALRGQPLPERDRNAAWRSVLLWDEHTWGADRSISEPDSPETLAQWVLKQRFALDGDSASRALLKLALSRRTPATTTRIANSIDMWNTHETVHRGVTIIPESLSRGRDQGRDARGRDVPAQRLRDGSLAVKLPLQPIGVTRIALSADGPVAQSPRAEAHAAHADGDSLWTDRLVVHISRETGAIASARWRHAGRERELVDATRGGWNRYRYVLGRDTSRAHEATRTRIEVVDDGPLVATLRIISDAPGAKSLRRDVSLQSGSDAIDVVTTLDKTAVRDKEAVHIAFPLNVPRGTVRMEQGLAIVRPELDQAAGANRNVYPVQRWLDASNAEYGVTVVTPDLPLWQLNGLTAEAFKQPDGREDWLWHSLPGTEFVAYAMNNYWHTNFKADQPGLVTFRVTLVPHGPFDAATATRLGLIASEPPVVTHSADREFGASLFTLDNAQIVLSSVTSSRDAKAMIVRMWNPGATPATVGFRWARSHAQTPRTWISSPAEERGKPLSGRVMLPPFGTSTLRIEWVR